MADRNSQDREPSTRTRDERDRSQDDDAPGGTSGTADEAGKTPTPSEQESGTAGSDESSSGGPTGNGE